MTPIRARLSESLDLRRGYEASFPPNQVNDSNMGSNGPAGSRSGRASFIASEGWTPCGRSLTRSPSPSPRIRARALDSDRVRTQPRDSDLSLSLSLRLTRSLSRLRPGPRSREKGSDRLGHGIIFAPKRGAKMRAELRYAGPPMPGLETITLTSGSLTIGRGCCMTQPASDDRAQRGQRSNAVRANQTAGADPGENGYRLQAPVQVRQPYILG